MTDFTPKQDVFYHFSAPKNVKELSQFLMERVHLPCSPMVLEQFFSRYPIFFDVIPFLWEQAKESLPVIRPLHEVDRIELTQLDALRILSHSFFCSFERDSHRWEVYPSINMDRLFVEPSQMYLAKLGMIFEYFLRQKKRWDAGDLLDRKIVFQLQTSSKTFGYKNYHSSG